MSKDEAVETAAEPAVTDSAPVVEEAQADDKDVMEMSLDELDTSESDTDGEEESKEEAPAEETPQEEAKEESEAPQNGDKPLAPKSENRFQKLANKNREYEQNLNNPQYLQERLAQLNSRETQVATEQELMNQVNPETGEYYTPADAERIARYQVNEQTQQTLAQERYQLEVQQNQQALGNEATEVMQEFKWAAEFVPGTERFDPSTGQVTGEKNPEYKPVLAERAAALLESSLIRDPNTPEVDPYTGQPTGRGAIVGSQLSPKQIYQTINESLSFGATQGELQGQKATQAMLANADVSASASQAKKSKVDPDLEAFDQEAGF